jgi:hypothetical protein
MSGSAVNPRSVTDAERPWLLSWSTDAQRELLRGLRAAGHSNAVTLGVLGFLTARALGEPDGLAPQQRSEYRKALKALGPPIMLVAWPYAHAS